jgi:hypothetical protein
MERFYTYSNGKYWGSVADGDNLPFEGALQVSAPPPLSADQIWNGSAWSEYTAPVPLLTQLNTLYLTLDTPTQIQFLPYVGGIFALLTQGQTVQAKSLLAAIPTTGAASTVQAEMLGVLNGI